MAERSTRIKRPTQADVARRAGVSQPMVSYVLNGNEALPVPDETRQRIRDAIDELGYVPHRAARSLRTRKTYTLASIIPDITNPFYPAFQRGIQDVADQRGYDLVLYNTDGEAGKEHKCLHSVLQGRADAIIGVFFHLRAPDLRVLLGQGIAIVRLETRAHTTGDLPLDSLYVDNAAAAYAAVSYLIERGHTRIGMLAGRGGPRETRLAGYRRALADKGLAADERWIRSVGFTDRGGYDGMRQLLELAPHPTAVFAANDLIAIGALRAIREADLRVPDDIAVVGFDDIPAAQLVSPALTTVAQFSERLGRRAAEMVLERLDGRVHQGGRSEMMPFELIVRQSA